MRIIGGSARGRKLTARPGLDTRPTSDRAREALFNILTQRVSGAAFLDLFAGTGAVGVEALSRGAAFAVFADKDPAAAAIAAANASGAGFCNFRVMREDAIAAIARLEREKARFDLVFMDPPYNTDLCGRTCAALARRRILAEDALVIAEITAGQEIEHTGFTETDRRRYGAAQFVFLKEAR